METKVGFGRKDIEGRKTGYEREKGKRKDMEGRNEGRIRKKRRNNMVGRLQ
jgi:hypothetical protein